MILTQACRVHADLEKLAFSQQGKDSSEASAERAQSL